MEYFVSNEVVGHGALSILTLQWDVANSGEHGSFSRTSIMQGDGRAGPIL